MSGRADLPGTPLRRWRVKSGVPYERLARESGIPLRTIMAIAAGRAVSVQNARKLAEHTERLGAPGVPVHVLLGLALEALQASPRRTDTAEASGPASSRQAPARARRKGIDL